MVKPATDLETENTKLLEKNFGGKGVLGNIRDVKFKEMLLKSTDIKAKIESALKRTSADDGHRVTVEAANGKVILRGFVHTWSEREEAQHTAWAAPGVKEVEDHIAIA